jgi:hypothetical protein
MCAKAQVVCIDATHQGMGSGEWQPTGFYSTALLPLCLPACGHPGFTVIQGL